MSGTNELVCFYHQYGAETEEEQITVKNTSQVPVSGKCPTCEGQELWGDLIKKKRGCYSHVQDLLSSLEEEDEEDE